MFLKEQYLELIAIGFSAGAYGTLIGAGGGFVLMPILLLLYPKENPEILASISLAVVFFNGFEQVVNFMDPSPQFVVFMAFGGVHGFL